MTIEILVEKDSSPEEIETAYQAIAFGYRTVVFDYVRRQNIQSVSELAREAGCSHPELIEQFIKDASVAPPSKDLDYFIGKAGGHDAWLSQIRYVQIHASVIHPEPANYPRTIYSQRRRLLIDFAIREALAKMTWFYLESSERFLRQHPE